jgi:hypothetical protein
MKRAEENGTSSSKKNFTSLPYDGYETTNLVLGGGIPKTQPKSLASKYANLMKDTKSTLRTIEPNYTTVSPGRRSPLKKTPKSPSPLNKSKTSVSLNAKGMIISLKQTPTKEDRIFEDDNVPDYTVDNDDKYTLEGISGMVIMDRVHNDQEIKKGESATSGQGSDNSDQRSSENSDNEKEQTLNLNQSQKMTLDI